MKRLFLLLTALTIFPAATGVAATRASSDGPPETVTIPAGEFWMGRAEFQWLFDRNTEIERERLDD